MEQEEGKVKGEVEQGKREEQGGRGNERER